MESLDDLVRELRSRAQPSSPEVVPERAPRKGPASPRIARMRFLGAALVCGVALVLVIGRQPPTPTPRVPLQSSSPTPSASVDASQVTRPTAGQWMQIVQTLDAARAGAFTAPRRADLLRVDAPSSPALQHDRALVTALLAAGVHADRFPLTVTNVVEEFLTMGATNPSARLRVTDSLADYQLDDPHGVPVRTVTGRGEREWIIDLMFRPGIGWRYVSIVSAASQR